MRFIALLLLLLPGPLWAGPLPLGRPGLPETRQQRGVVPGLTLTDISRGRVSGHRDWSDPTVATGPWQVHVLEVDPGRLDGDLDVGLGGGQVLGTATVRTMARRAGAVAAVNGGFFVRDRHDGQPGSLVGYSARHGLLLHEALPARCCLWIGRKGFRIAPVQAGLTVVAGDGASYRIDGIDRTPGRVRDLGLHGDLAHDHTRRVTSDMVLFNRGFGASTLAGPGVEAVLNQGGRVTSIRRRGGHIPCYGQVVAGIGQAATWLRRHGLSGLRVPTADVWDAINGGPWLVRQGRVAVDDQAEGFDRPFSRRRTARTLAGITRTGHLLLVVVDGKRPDWSVGVTFEEAARLMQSLGAWDAMGLDGGGSSTMVVEDRLANRPADPGGERSVADALLIYAAGWPSAGSMPSKR